MEAFLFCSEAIDGFAEFLSRYEARVFNFMLRLSGDPVRAEDALQQFSVEAFSRFGELRNEEHIEQWVFRHAVAAVEERLSDPSDAAPAGLFGERTNLVEELIARLPLEYREVFLLHDVEGFDCAESAAIIGLSAAEAKERIHRARLMMRRGYNRGSSSVEEKEISSAEQLSEAALV